MTEASNYLVSRIHISPGYEKGTIRINIFTQKAGPSHFTNIKNNSKNCWVDIISHMKNQSKMTAKNRPDVSGIRIMFVNSYGN